MTDKKEELPAGIKGLIRFYFAPELRSIVTIFYLVTFAYTTIFYFNNAILAFRFLGYLIHGTDGFSGIALLFTGLAFFVSLLFPFSTSIYAIFTLAAVWRKPAWSDHLKWVITAIMIVGALFIILMTDEASRIAARMPVMQSFVEDAGLTGRI